MRNTTLIVLTTLAVLVMGMTATAVAGPAFAGDRVPRMEAAELLEKLDSPDVMVIDVRRSKDWDGSEEMIKNAHRKPYNDVDSWAADIPRDKTIVLYCA